MRPCLQGHEDRFPSGRCRICWRAYRRRWRVAKGIPVRGPAASEEERRARYNARMKFYMRIYRKKWPYGRSVEGADA